MGSMTGLHAFDTTIHKTNEWLRDVQEKIHTEEKQVAYHALRSVLINLRDRLTINEAVHLGDQLPMLVRGIYYEGWNPNVNPTRLRNRQEFFDLVDAFLRPDIQENPEMITRAVFEVLNSRISAGEASDVKGMLPQDLRQLWPQVGQA